MVRSSNLFHPIHPNMSMSVHTMRQSKMLHPFNKHIHKKKKKNFYDHIWSSNYVQENL